MGFPKGSVDEGETPEDAVLRELTEETGVQWLDCWTCQQ